MDARHRGGVDARRIGLDVRCSHLTQAYSDGPCVVAASSAMRAAVQTFACS